MDDMWTQGDALRQLRVHFLLEEHFRLTRAARPRVPLWMKVAAALLLLVGSQSSCSSCTDMNIR